MVIILIVIFVLHQNSFSLTIKRLFLFHPFPQSISFSTNTMLQSIIKFCVTLLWKRVKNEVIFEYVNHTCASYVYSIHERKQQLCSWCKCFHFDCIFPLFHLCRWICNVERKYKQSWELWFVEVHHCTLNAFRASY